MRHLLTVPIAAVLLLAVERLTEHLLGLGDQLVIRARQHATRRAETRAQVFLRAE